MALHTHTDELSSHMDAYEVIRHLPLMLIKCSLLTKPQTGDTQPRFPQVPMKKNKSMINKTVLVKAQDVISQM